MQKLSSQTYYEVLEVAPDAAPHDILHAYHRAKEAYTIDGPALYTMFTPAEARELLGLIEEAFSTLSSPGRRRDYDLQLVRGRLAEKTPEPPTEPKESPKTFQAPVTSSPKQNSQELKSGEARTRFGIYKVDPAFEKEIQETKEMDGAFLKRIRLYKNVQPEQIVEFVRISKTYLIALEANNFSALPAPVFVRGFVGQIARALGLNDTHIANSYMEYFRKARPQAE